MTEVPSLSPAQEPTLEPVLEGHTSSDHSGTANDGASYKLQGGEGSCQGGAPKQGACTFVLACLCDTIKEASIKSYGLHQGVKLLPSEQMVFVCPDDTAG